MSTPARARQTDSAKRTVRLVRGTPASTRTHVLNAITSVSGERVLWVSERDEQLPDSIVTASNARRHLGSEYAVVILDLHDQFRPDELGAAHGLVLGGGTLMLRCPPEFNPPAEHGSGLAAPPHTADDVETHLWEHIVRALEPATSTAPTVADVEAPNAGTTEQRRVATRLSHILISPGVSATALTGRRGRGKSSTVGIALRQILRQPSSDAPRQIVLTGPAKRATRQIAVHAVGRRRLDSIPTLEYRDIGTLLGSTSTPADILVVDEAAQIPVHALERLANSTAIDKFVFISTIDGYEGTARGFTVRFLPWLADRYARFEHLTLTRPVRWAEDDALEHAMTDALLLDAEPATLPAYRQLDDHSKDHDVTELTSAELAKNPSRLRQVYGLFRDAHYQTRPSDLHRMLDAPNMRLYGIIEAGDVIGATWIAIEGALPQEDIDSVYRGRQRITGHALAEQLVERLGCPDAGSMKMVRFVRTAVHPERRREGLATTLVEHVERTYSPDLLGTIFSARPAAVRFRQSVGYRSIRLGASPTRTSGVPSLTMIHPVTDPATSMARTLRAEFTHNLEVRLDLLAADLGFEPGEALFKVLGAMLEDAPSDIPEERIRQRVDHYAHGPPTFESVAHALESYVRRRLDALRNLDDTHERLIRARVLERCSWEETAERADMNSVRAAMRGLRRAIRAMVN